MVCVSALVANVLPIQTFSCLFKLQVVVCAEENQNTAQEKCSMSEKFMKCWRQGGLYSWKVMCLDHYTKSIKFLDIEEA